MATRLLFGVDLLFVREAQLERDSHPVQSQFENWNDFSGFFRCYLSVIDNCFRVVIHDALIVSGVVSLGVDVNPIDIDSFGITALFLLVCLGLWNQALCFIVCIPVDPVQEGKAITHGDTSLTARGSPAG
jgi:hypothetical protein